jgi:hypothetical protein
VVHHKVPDLLKQARRLTLPMSPPPSQFARHAEVIDPIAETYADLYYAHHGFSVRAESLERFLEFDLGLSYGWKDIAEPDGVHILAQHDPIRGAINPNLQYKDFFERNPALLASALLHELGHIALRHGELYTNAGSLTLPGMQSSRSFLHRMGWLPLGISEEQLKRAAKVACIDKRVRDALKPDRYEPDWVYQQAQRFAAAFMIPHALLQKHLEKAGDLTRWSPVYELARRFATSPSMMRYRLEKLGYIIVQGKDVNLGSRLMQKPLL